MDHRVLEAELWHAIRVFHTPRSVDTIKLSSNFRAAVWWQTTFDGNPERTKVLVFDETYSAWISFRNLFKPFAFYNRRLFGIQRLQNLWEPATEKVTQQIKRLNRGCQLLLRLGSDKRSEQAICASIAYMRFECTNAHLLVCYIIQLRIRLKRQW